MRAWYSLLLLLLVVPAAAQPWQPTEFPLGYWCGPPAKYNNLASWQAIKDCNFTWAMAGGYDAAGNRQMLDFCQKVGLRAMVLDGRLNWQMAMGDNWRAAIREVVTDYSRHPALYGYFIQDEPSSLADATVKGGILTMTFTGADPYFCRPWLRVTPDQYTKIRVRMKLPPCDPMAQFFWATAREPAFDDSKYLAFPVQPDGQWHEYTIPMGTHEKWRGQAIRAIRLDATTGEAAPGSKVEIDWIRGE